jgi:hypothetical protein
MQWSVSGYVHGNTVYATAGQVRIGEGLDKMWAIVFVRGTGMIRRGKAEEESSEEQVAFAGTQEALRRRHLGDFKPYIIVHPPQFVDMVAVGSQLAFDQVQPDLISPTRKSPWKGNVEKRM